MEDHQVVGIILDALSSSVEYNILLIGDSEDKSKFRKAFAKYFKFSSLDEAMAGDGEWDEVTKSSVVTSQRVCTFRQNDKLFRLIDPCKKGTRYKPYIRAMRQCVADYPKLHAIVVVVEKISKSNDIASDLYFERTVLPLLSIIPKNACNNVVLCFTKNSTCEISNETFAQLQSNLGNNTTITPHRGQNMLIVDSCVLECLADHGQRTYSDKRINQCRTSWIEARQQFQSMIDYMASREPCEMTNVVELMQAIEILLSHFKNRHYYSSSYSERSSRAECLIENATKQILLKLLALVMHLTMIRPLVMVKSIFQLFSNLKSDDKFLNKLQVSENRQLVEVKLSQCSATDYFHELFNELSKMGSNFANEITLLCPNEIEHVASILIENNLLHVERADPVDPDVVLSDLIFSCDLSSRTVNLVLNNLSNFLNINPSDILFFTDNIDSLIKHKLLDLLPVILCKCMPKKEVNLNKQHDDCFCLIM